MSDTLPSALVALIKARDEQREQAVADLLASFTERERLLIKEAVVAGYVRGHMHSSEPEMPPDSVMLRRAMQTWLDFPDLYPTGTNYQESEEEDGQGQGGP